MWVSIGLRGVRDIPETKLVVPLLFLLINICNPRYKPYDYRTTTYTAVIQQYTKYTTVTIM